jgi:hypothetical protein
MLMVPYCAGQVQSGFFGFNWAANNVTSPPDNNPWPTPIGSSFGRFRTWDTPTGWFYSETSRCTSPCDPSSSAFNWASLDKLVSDVLTANSSAKIEITTGAGDVPGWANGTCQPPTQQPCMKPNPFVLPSDVSDTTTACTNIPAAVRTGTGSANLFPGDCQWQEFVYALAEHECSTCSPSSGTYQGKLTFRSLSPGNEVNTTNFLTSPCSMTTLTVCDALIKMQADACKILKWVDSTFTGCGTPSFTDANDGNVGTYLTEHSSLIPGSSNLAGYYADVLIGHIYGDPNPNHAGQPEISAGCNTCRSWKDKIMQFTDLLTPTNEMSGKLFRIDEGGWGRNFQTNTAGQACSSDTTCGCLSAPIKSCMDANSLVTETITGTGDKLTFTNAPAPGYVVRSYLQVLSQEGTSNQIDSFFWYNPGSDEWGSFANCPTVSNVNCGTSITTSDYTASTYAYLSLYQWAVGSTFDPAGIQNTSGSTKYTYAINAKSGNMGCSSNPTDSGYSATIAWDIGTNPSTLACGSYTQYCSVFSGTAQHFNKDGAHTCTAGTSITLGPNPILFEHN